LRAALLVPSFITVMVIATAILIQSLKLPVGEIANFLLIMVSCLGIGAVLSVICRRKLLTDFINAIKSSS